MSESSMSATQALALKCAKNFMLKVGFIPTACRSGEAVAGMIVPDFGSTEIPGYRFQMMKKGRRLDFEILRNVGITRRRKIPQGYEMWRMVLLKAEKTQ